MTVGEELRHARERAGLSIEDISQRIRLQMYKIDAFENGDFAHLPDGVHLDEFVRAYARELGVDPEPLVRRVREERTVFATPLADGQTDLDAFDSEDTETRTDLDLDEFHQEAAVNAAIVVPDPVIIKDSPNVARSPQPIRPVRRAAVALGIVAVFVAAGLGGYLGGSLYQTTRARNADTVGERRTSLSERVSDDVAPVERERAARPAQEPATRERRTLEPDSAEPGTTEAATSDLSGAWRLATHVESARYSQFNDLRLGYDLQLKQAGEHVTGVGRKVTENGRPLRSRARTPITVEGIVDGDQLTLNFTERGIRRRSQGQFALMVDDSGTLRGRFSSDAGQSSGTAEARRVTQ